MKGRGKVMWGGGGAKWPKKKMRCKESRHNVVIHFEGVKELT